MTTTIKKLIITVIEGKGLKETNLFTKMTTYVHFKCGGEEFKTKPAEKQDKNPKFNNQSFIFNLDGKEDVVHILIYSKETLSDDRIGRMDVKIADLAKAEKPTWFSVFDMDNFSKERGHLCLSVECEPKPHHHKKEEQKAATTTTTTTVQQPQVQVQQPQVQVQQVQQQPQVVYQQQQPQYTQPMMAPQMGVPMMMPQMGMPMGIPEVIINPATGQTQVVFAQPMMQQPMVYGQPQQVYGQPQQMYGQPVVIFPNQQQQR